MEDKTKIKILISALISLVINSFFSITDIVKELLKNSQNIPGYEWLNSFLVLCFFTDETALIYSIVTKIDDNLP